MAVMDVMNTAGERVSQVELADDIFDVPVKPSVLHAVVRMQQAAKRSGTADVKNRSEIRGSTRKLFRQKGTGRARRGDIKDPLLRGGGVIFGPTPRSYAFKLPKRVRRLALKMALSAKRREEAGMMVLDKIDLEQVKTKAFVKMLENLGLKEALIVTADKDRTLELSSRNVPHVKVMRCEGLNVYDVLKHKTLVLLEPSIKGIEGRLTAS